MLPRTAETLVLRTDFSRPAAWNAVRSVTATPSADGFLPGVEFLDDPGYRDLTVAELLALVPKGDEDGGEYAHPILVVADTVALASGELPLLVVDLWEERGRTIRVVATELWGIENNLSLANMDFFEFAESVDEDGVFRGF
ncbi:DUF6924 domain-containing protein [Streptomyces sp. NPDC059009]|uniref:DUF6924 domain-containing protein n=1 Tax=Streptomyces sp. NPDC059009 TaxID=3346694 RepID=UPI0036CD5E11